MTTNRDEDSAASSARLDWRAGRHLRRRLVLAAVRVVLVTVLLCALYFRAPLDRSDSQAVLQICAALLAYTAIVVWQITAVASSSYPRLRGIEAAAVSLPLLIFLFAANASRRHRPRRSRRSGHHRAHRRPATTADWRRPTCSTWPFCLPDSTSGCRRCLGRTVAAAACRY